jgi:dipeptide/tripeptide permease
VFEGTCYITPLLGAYLADSHWGRYKTILVFSTIYFCGCVLLTATSGLPGLTPGVVWRGGCLGLGRGGGGRGVSIIYSACLCAAHGRKGLSGCKLCCWYGRVFIDCGSSALSTCVPACCVLLTTTSGLTAVAQTVAVVHGRSL